MPHLFPKSLLLASLFCASVAPAVAADAPAKRAIALDDLARLQLTFDKEGISNPLFSPDGKYISFLSSRPGPAKGPQVWGMDRRGGEAQQLTAISDQST